VDSEQLTMNIIRFTLSRSEMNFSVKTSKLGTKKFKQRSVNAIRSLNFRTQFEAGQQTQKSLQGQRA